MVGSKMGAHTLEEVGPPADRNPSAFTARASGRHRGHGPIVAEDDLGKGIHLGVGKASSFQSCRATDRRRGRPPAREHGHSRLAPTTDSMVPPRRTCCGYLGPGGRPPSPCGGTGYLLCASFATSRRGSDGAWPRGSWRPPACGRDPPPRALPGRRGYRTGGERAPRAPRCLGDTQLRTEHGPRTCGEGASRRGDLGWCFARGLQEAARRLPETGAARSPASTLVEERSVGPTPRTPRPEEGATGIAEERGARARRPERATPGRGRARAAGPYVARRREARTDFEAARGRGASRGGSSAHLGRRPARPIAGSCWSWVHFAGPALCGEGQGAL